MTTRIAKMPAARRLMATACSEICPSEFHATSVQATNTMKMPTVIQTPLQVVLGKCLNHHQLHVVSDGRPAPLFVEYVAGDELQHIEGKDREKRRQQSVEESARGV